MRAGLALDLPLPLTGREADPKAMGSEIGNRLASRGASFRLLLFLKTSVEGCMHCVDVPATSTPPFRIRYSCVVFATQICADSGRQKEIQELAELTELRSDEVHL
jgi:hypothetical protein